MMCNLLVQQLVKYKSSDSDLCMLISEDHFCFCSIQMLGKILVGGFLVCDVYSNCSITVKMLQNQC